MKPSRIEIAQIVADGRPGGGTTMMLGLIDDLAAEPAIRFTVVSEPGSYAEREALRRGIRFIGFNFFRYGLTPALPWLLARILAPLRFDLTHLHGLRTAHCASRWPARSRLGRLVYTIHGLHQLYLHPVIRWTANLAERRVMRRVGQCVFVSHADLDQARKWGLLPLGGRTPTVIWNGIDVDAVCALAAPEKDVDVAFVGRLVDQKQPLLAAHMLATLATSGWRCALAGGGPLEAACGSLLRHTPGGNAVQLLGELSHQAAMELVGRTRVVLMPSAWEGLPILPMEAMALGATLVGTRLPGMAEVVADGVTGVLVAPGEAAAMRNAVEQVLKDLSRERAMADAAAQRVRKLFDRRITSGHYLDIYRSMLQPDAAATERGNQGQNAQ